MPSPEVIERFIAKVESNDHVAAIEEFYTEGASMRENGQPPRKGRAALVANERKALARMKSVRSRCVRPVLVDGDHAVIRWNFDFETPEGGQVHMDELAYQRWEGDRIAEEQFFYDPRQLEPALFTVRAFRATELREADVPALQAFYAANPEYSRAVHGRPPTPTEAREEFDDVIPEGFTYDRRWLFKMVDEDGAMVAMASVVSSFLAKDVWHVGLFIVATRLHGSGAAREIYAALETWMRARGARWLRLGVVVGNARAERFWESLGYAETRRRLGLAMGDKVNDLRVMAKPLAGGSIADYLALVARDRPEAP
jgi:RimJ/RimL family protein N-acetyltransferase